MAYLIYAISKSQPHPGRGTINRKTEQTFLMGNVSLGLTSNELDSILDKVSRNPRIQKVVLFGSRAKGNFKDGSDNRYSIVRQ